jgi:5-methylthioadenosine/S-adenosylhomocysteine deaminase
MLFSDIDYLDSNYETKHGYVLVENSKIAYIGEQDPTKTPDFQTAKIGQRYNGKGKLLMPGLYNAHTHIPMILLRGYAEGLPLQSWLFEKIFPFEAKITNQIALPASQLAIAEMLRFGTVSFTDMYFFDEARIEAIASSGIKCNLSSGMNIFDPEIHYQDTPNFDLTNKLIAQHHNTLNGRLRIDLNIHSEYLSNPYVVRSVGEQAVELGVNTHIHLSETRTEHEECKQRRGGLTPAAYFESLDFFKQPCTAAHGVYTEPDDWQILARNNVTIVPCVCSNAKLASGFAPVPQFLEAGVNVAIGTDGVASNNNHNLFKELYSTAVIYKGSSQDPTVVSPAQALAAATINGAHSQSRENCGAIAVGNQADLLVLDTDVPWMQPAHNQLNNLIYAAQGSDVVLTMVDGEVLYSNGEWKTIDVERAASQTQQATCNIISSL